jgi:hypothetical protein
MIKNKEQTGFEKHDFYEIMYQNKTGKKRPHPIP